jgi:amino acid transporter
VTERPAAATPPPPAGGLASWARSFGAVAWSFFGVRRSADYAQDVQKLHPGQVIVTGVVLAAVFVTGLVLLVRWVVGSGVAG